MRRFAAQLCLLGGLLASYLFYLGAPYIDSYWLHILTLVGINVTLAVSLNLINGYTGQFSLGHSGFMAIGAYTAAATTLLAGPKLLPLLGGAQSTLGVGALFFFALLAGGILAAIAGLVVGGPSLRLKGDYLAIVTLGFGEIISVIFRNIPSLGGALGLTGIPPHTNVFWTYGVAAITIYTVLALVHSTYGRGFIAVRDDEIAAEAMGINTTRYKITAFVLGSFFAGIAGGLFAHQISAIDPRGFTFMRSIEIVVFVILGGMGNTLGVILAAVLLTILTEYLRGIGEWRMLIYSFLLIVLMLTRPQGLFRWKFGPRVKPAANPTLSS
ncbi:MAG TPA: branched-chain amino acid ABC transporter permease [Verrucomicrobiae bacterium]